jgi:hypothetical protein
MIRKQVLLGGALLVLAMLACSLPGLRTPAPGGGGSSKNVLMQDNFSNPKSGWEVGEYNSGKVGYADGQYFVISYGKGSTMWGVANRSFDNVVIDVEATPVSGPDNNDYGIVCREQGDGRGYYFLISGDGYYAIVKGTDEGYDWLVDFTESNAIQQGYTTNRIRAVCNGSQLSLYVNGQRVGEASDTEFSSGDIALTATSYEDEPVEVRFDNLVVTAP